MVDLCYLQIYLLAKFICSPQINTYETFAVICRHEQSGKIFESSEGTFPVEDGQGNTLPSWFSSFKQAFFSFFI